MTLSIAVRLGKVATQIRQRAIARVVTVVLTGCAKAVKAMATPMYKPYNRLLFSFMYLLISAEQ